MALSVRGRRMAMGGLLVAMVAVAAPALAGPGKGYTVHVGDTAVAGTTVAFDVKLTVPSRQQQQLGSARLTVPTGFTLLSATVDGPAIVTPSGPAVTLDGLAIQPGSSRTVTVRAAVPCGTVGSRWTAEAKQANEFNGTGNDLLLDVAGSTLDTPVAGECAPCPVDGGCTLDELDGNSAFTVTGSGSPAEGRLTLALGTDLEIDCPGYAEVMGETALFNVTGGRTKTAELVVAKNDLPRGGPQALELCFAAPVPFAGSSVQGSYDWDGDGTATAVHVGLLPDCADAEAPEDPCVTGRGKNGSGAGVISSRLPEGDPGMRG